MWGDTGCKSQLLVFLPDSGMLLSDFYNLALVNHGEGKSILCVASAVLINGHCLMIF